MTKTLLALAGVVLGSSVVACAPAEEPSEKKGTTESHIEGSKEEADEEVSEDESSCEYRCDEDAKHITGHNDEKGGQGDADGSYSYTIYTATIEKRCGGGKWTKHATCSKSCAYVDTDSGHCSY